MTIQTQHQEDNVWTNRRRSIDSEPIDSNPYQNKSGIVYRGQDAEHVVH